MAFYDDMSDVATELLTEFGRPMTFQRVTDVFNEITGKNESRSVVEYSPVGVETAINQTLIDGTRIQAGDRLIVIDAATDYVPEMGDLLVDGATGAYVPPTGCGITLTNAGLGPYGLAPMTVVGQTVSVTGDGTSNYCMWSGSPGKSVSWTGLRAVEFNTDVNPAHGSAIHQIVRGSNFYNFGGYFDASISKWFIFHGNSSGGLIGSVKIAGALTDTITLLIDGTTGDASVMINGVVVVDKTTTPYSGVLTGLGGMFAGDTAIISMLAISTGSGDTAQATARTNGTTYTQAYPAGVKDWCGNAI